MGRRSRNQSALPLEQPVRVKLTDEDRATKAHQMACKRQAYRAVKRELKRHMRAAKEQLEQIEAEMDVLADALVADEEMRSQGDIRFEQGSDNALPKDAAAHTLGEIAKRAERHPFVGDGDTCGREACTATKRDEVHTPPAATERHTYVPTAEGTCWACSEPRDAAVHAEPAGIESTNRPSNETGEIAAPPLRTFVCADCDESGASLEASTHPVSEGLWLGTDGRKVCANCRQVAIEGGRWPHEFEALKPMKRGKPPVCKHCELFEADAVHQAAATAPAQLTEEQAAAALATPEEQREQPQPTDETPDSAPAREEGGQAFDPAYDFDENEPKPAAIATHAAVERDLGGEAGGA